MSREKKIDRYSRLWERTMEEQKITRAVLKALTKVQERAEEFEAGHIGVYSESTWPYVRNDLLQTIGCQRVKLQNQTKLQKRYHRLWRVEVRIDELKRSFSVGCGDE